MKKIITMELEFQELLEGIRTIVGEELKIQHQLQQLEKLLSGNEARQLFYPPISKVTLYNWTRQGKLQSYRIGRRVFYKYSDVLQAMTTLGKYKKGI